MSFNPGVHMSYAAQLPRVATGAMMVPVTPVRQVALVPVSTMVVGAPHVQTAPIQIQSSATITHQAKPVLVADASTESKGENVQVVTVFVGNITERASDTLVRQILMKCGTIYAWKRVQGASGKLQAFGFCEYKEPEAALRAISLLHDFKLGDKKLLVKVDSKTQELIDAWKKKNAKTSNYVPGMVDARSSLEVLLREYQVELNTPVASEALDAPKKKEYPLVRESVNVEENLQELDLEKDQKDYISKEIRSFREAQKAKEAAKLKEKKEKEEELRAKEDKERERERERRKERERERERERDRDRSRHRDHRSSEHSRVTRSPSRSRSRRSPPRRSERRSRTPRRSPVMRRRSPSLTRRRGDEDEETYERRRLERKIREKEAAYQERLKAWEIRERRKKREYEIRDDREERERKELLKEAKRLQEFLADYEDEASDHKYYVGSAMSKRRRDYDREIEADKRDRKKESDEIDVLRTKLTKDGYEDVQGAVDKSIRESESVWKPPLKRDTPPREKSVEPNHSSSSSSESESESEHEAEKSESGSSRMDTQTTDSENSTHEMEPETIPSAAPVQTKRPPPTRGFTPIGENITNGSKSNSTNNSPMFNHAQRASSLNRQEPVMQLPMGAAAKRKKFKVSEIFNDDESEDEAPKKRKLVPHTLTESEKLQMQQASRSVEDRTKAVRSLIEQIPTKKEDLFDYSLDWSMVDKTLMDKRIQPWVRKKIVEYIGEEEPTLVEFICSKIMTKSNPDRILEDVSMVLDDEAEVFVVKMWRLLIYETEAKKEGLNK